MAYRVEQGLARGWWTGDLKAKPTASRKRVHTKSSHPILLNRSRRSVAMITYILCGHYRPTVNEEKGDFFDRAGRGRTLNRTHFCREPKTLRVSSRLSCSLFSISPPRYPGKTFAVLLPTSLPQWSQPGLWCRAKSSRYGPGLHFSMIS